MSDIVGRTDLCAWLRANSSGIYRPAAEAADEIERLRAELNAKHGDCALMVDENFRLEKEIERLRAALAEPKAEPVAWQSPPGCGLKRYMTQRQYEAQTPATQSWYSPVEQRKPLTDDELDAMRQADNGSMNFVTLREFRLVARAIERAHGIGDKA